MPRGEGRSKRRVAAVGGRTNTGSSGKDFTLYDYAHAAASADKSKLKSCRVKKSELGAWGCEVKQLSQSASTTSSAALQSMGAVADPVDGDWFDRDLSEFDDTTDEEGVEGEGRLEKEIERKKKQLAHSIESSRGKGISSCSNSSAIQISERGGAGNGGMVYPTDVWSLIGRFVWPEDVESFAAVCRGSHAVTHSAQFWHRLYQRYYSPTLTSLPFSLTPPHMDRAHGLKPRVIRALHFLYAPFINRSSRLTDLDDACSPRLDALVGSTCRRQWYVRGKTTWHFYWLFVRASHAGSGRDKSRADRLRAAPSVVFNADAGSVALAVVAPNFIPFPDVVGLMLVKVVTSGGQRVAVAQGVGPMGHARGHRLQLTFNTHFVRGGGAGGSIGGGGGGKGGGGGGTVACVDPTLSVDVMHWWHPMFPGTCHA